MTSAWGLGVGSRRFCSAADTRPLRPWTSQGRGPGDSNYITSTSLRPTQAGLTLGAHDALSDNLKRASPMLRRVLVVGRDSCMWRLRCWH